MKGTRAAGSIITDLDRQISSGWSHFLWEKSEGGPVTVNE